MTQVRSGLSLVKHICSTRTRSSGAKCCRTRSRSCWWRTRRPTGVRGPPREKVSASSTRLWRTRCRTMEPCRSMTTSRRSRGLCSDPSWSCWVPRSSSRCWAYQAIRQSAPTSSRPFVCCSDLTSSLTLFRLRRRTTLASHSRLDVFIVLLWNRVIRFFFD